MLNISAAQPYACIRPLESDIEMRPSERRVSRPDIAEAIPHQAKHPQVILLDPADDMRKLIIARPQAVGGIGRDHFALVPVGITDELLPPLDQLRVDSLLDCCGHFLYLTLSNPSTSIGQPLPHFGTTLISCSNSSKDPAPASRSAMISSWTDATIG